MKCAPYWWLVQICQYLLTKTTLTIGRILRGLLKATPPKNGVPMGISNVSNGLRSGVCTSSTRPTAPYEGQMIYETDTDLVRLWNGTTWYTIASTNSYYRVQEVYFTSTGTFSKATYPWLKAIKVRLVGGGGGSSGCGGVSGGSGGAGGGYAESFITDIASLASSVTVTVGGGGGGGSSSPGDGSAGGTSSFGSLVSATGGGGGVITGSDLRGGSGGVGTAGQLLIKGGGGGVYTSLRASGTGGSSVLGGGGLGRFKGGSGQVSGEAGGNYGGGAGGPSSVDSSIAGSAGAPGVVILELFA